jgi:hypothetical protein
MAKQKKAIHESAEFERKSPRAVMIALLLAFLGIAIVGVFTVVIPEISDDGEESEAEEGATEPEAPPSEDAP